MLQVLLIGDDNQVKGAERTQRSNATLHKSKTMRKQHASGMTLMVDGVSRALTVCS